jgi:hypothetical protein
VDFGGVEVSEDKHYTNPHTAVAIIRRLIQYGDIQAGDRILDPCVGKGAFPNAVRMEAQGQLDITTVDSDPMVQAHIHADFLQFGPCNPFQLIVSNPPFSQGQAFAEHALSLIDSRGTVAFLMLLQFLGSNGRAEFFRKSPPSTIDVLRPRPSFADNGQTDMREYALFRWCPQDFGSMSGPRIGWIDWEKPRKAKQGK